MKLKHTPERWHILPENPRAVYYHQYKVCETNNEVDARLIARSPKLYSTLCEARDQLLTAIAPHSDCRTISKLVLEDIIKVIAELEEGS